MWEKKKRSLRFQSIVRRRCLRGRYCRRCTSVHALDQVRYFPQVWKTTISVRVAKKISDIQVDISRYNSYSYSYPSDEREKERKRERESEREREREREKEREILHQSSGWVRCQRCELETRRSTSTSDKDSRVTCTRMRTQTHVNQCVHGQTHAPGHAWTRSTHVDIYKEEQNCVIAYAAGPA